jgi:hypothetical protein
MTRRFVFNPRTAAGVLLMLLVAPPLGGPAAAQTPPPDASATAAATERRALLGEPRLLAKGISWVEEFDRDELGGSKDGFYPELGQMITGAGWISAGPGYRQHLFGGRTLIDMSAAISWRAYKVAQARVEWPTLADERFSLGAQYLWHDFTQVRYFGTGRDSLETGASDYRVKGSDIVAYATWKPRARLNVKAAGSRPRPCSRPLARSTVTSRIRCGSIQRTLRRRSSNSRRSPIWIPRSPTTRAITPVIRDRAGYTERRSAPSAIVASRT